MMENEKATGRNGRWLTPGEAAKYLRVSREQVRTLIRKGRMKACALSVLSNPYLLPTRMEKRMCISRGYR